MASPDSPSLSSRHIPALDGIRGWAILMVMLYHQTIMYPQCRADTFFARCIGTGWMGVDLFFVLSGFLITGILLDAKGSGHYFRNFYARRTIRIFPLYYAVVFFSLVILPHIHHPKMQSFGRIEGDEWAYWLYLSNYTIAHAGKFRHGILDISWSLAIEEQFYLLWPLIVLVCSPRVLLRVSVAVIVAAFTVRCCLLGAGVNQIAIYVMTPCRMDGLAVGAIGAILARREGGLGRWLPVARWAAPVLLALGFAIAFRDFDFVMGGGNGVLTQSIGFTVNALGFEALLVMAAAGAASSLTVRFFNHAFMRTLGKFSYALYFFHLSVRAAIRDLVVPGKQIPGVLGSAIPGQLLFYVAATAVTLLGAWISWHVYEKQFFKLKRFFPRKERPVNAAPN